MGGFYRLTRRDPAPPKLMDLISAAASSRISLHPRTIRFIAGAVVLAAVFAVGFDFALYVQDRSHTIFDDAYMFVRYADHILAGQGMTWNVGEPAVYGVTNLGHLLTVIVGRALLPGLHPGLLLTSISVTMSVVAVLAMSGGAILAAGSRIGAREAGAILAFNTVCLFMAAAYRTNAVTGMGTMLGLVGTSLLIVATLWWIRREEPVRLAAVIAAAYLAFLIRPETLVAALVYPPVVRIALGSREARGRSVATYLGGLGLVIAVDALWKILVFGDPLALSYYAKQHGFYEGYLGAFKWNPVGHLGEFVRTLMPFVIIIALTARRRSLPALLAFGAPVALAVGYYFTVVQIMGFAARYYLPFAPFVVVGAAATAAAFLQEWQALPASQRWRRLARRTAVVFSLALLVSSQSFEEWATRRYEEWFGGEPVATYAAGVHGLTAARPLPALGWWPAILRMAGMIERFPDDVSVAMSEYGFVGARAPHVRILDPLGLHDPEVAHTGFSASRMLEERPALIWLPHHDYASINADILSVPRFWAEYDFFPGAFDFGLAVHRTAWDDHRLAPLIRGMWSLTYPDLPMEAYRAVRLGE